MARNFLNITKPSHKQPSNDMKLYYYIIVERHHLLTKRIIMMNDEKTGERGAGFFMKQSL